MRWAWAALGRPWPGRRLPGWPGLVLLALAAPARAAFERPPVGPAEAALGGVLAVGRDPVFGNPALAAGSTGSTGSAGSAASTGSTGSAGLLAWAARPFGLPELEESQAGAWVGGATWGVAAGVRRFGSGRWSEREGRLVLAAAPSGGVSLAVAVRGLEAGGAGVAPHRSAALDLAFRVRAGPAEIGGVAEAVLGEVPGDPAGLHRRSALGVARDLGPGRLLVEVQRAESRPLAARVGGALALPGGLRLRAGVQQDPAAVTWGFGLRLGALRLDVAAAEGTPLGRTVRLGVGLRPGPR